MKIAVSEIIVGKRREPVVATIEALTASIAEIGLINPITVSAPPEAAEKRSYTGPFTLIAGLHRLEAIKALGDEYIEATVLSGDDAELAEIDENLIRQELTEIERAQVAKRRLELLKERKQFSTESVEKSMTGRPKSNREEFIRETAAETGQSATVIRDSLRRAEQIAEDVQDAIVNLPAADSGVELDALASLTHDEQRQAVERVTTGVSESFRDAKEFIRGEDETEEQRKHRRELTALRKAWASASPAVRQTFWTEIKDFTFHA